MAIKSSDLTDLFSQPWTNGMSGRIEALRRNAGTNSTGYSTFPNAHVQALRAMIPDRPPRKHYDNPTSVGARPAAVIEPLTASDVAWLERLPTDPKDVSYDDARQLARLDGEFKSAGDRRLVRSILDPVRRYHNTLEAQAALENVTNNPAPVVQRGAALQMLSDAIRSETGDVLTSEEVHSRAAVMLDDALNKAASERTRLVRQAEARVAAAERPFNAASADGNPEYQTMMREAASVGDRSAARAMQELAASGGAA
jgi:hypothetical protein